MILKQGRIVIHHFAHKPPISCEWGAGETVAHMNAKRAFRDSLRLRGLRAEAEFVVDTMPGDRRADVMTWRSHDNQILAFELQHTPVSLDEIESRATAYARARIAQIWIPFLRSEALDTATRERGGLLIARYSPRPFEKWVHGLHLGKMWMYDPREQNLWLAFLQAHKIWVEETSGRFYLRRRRRRADGRGADSGFRAGRVLSLTVDAACLSGSPGLKRLRLFAGRAAV